MLENKMKQEKMEPIINEIVNNAVESSAAKKLQTAISGRQARKTLINKQHEAQAIQAIQKKNDKRGSSSKITRSYKTKTNTK